MELPSNSSLPTPHFVRTRDLYSKDSALDKLLHAQKQIQKGASVHVIAATLGQGDYLHALSKFITQDEAMGKVKNKICAIVQKQIRSPILITGPTGTGKELLARALRIPDEPFIAVNCGGLAKDLVPSLFFGHLKGAFTGASDTRQGVLVSAQKGVVFLDEIAELPEMLQSTLLRAIQENEIYPVGSVNPVSIQCQFIAATKHDLRLRVDQGLFREDLFARLYTHELTVTGLKERPNDIPLIAESLDWTNPIDENVLPDIYKFNVRAIQTYVERMTTYGYY